MDRDEFLAWCAENMQGWYPEHPQAVTVPGRHSRQRGNLPLDGLNLCLEAFIKGPRWIKVQVWTTDPARKAQLQALRVERQPAAGEFFSEPLHGGNRWYAGVRWPFEGNDYATQQTAMRNAHRWLVQLLEDELG